MHPPTGSASWRPPARAQGHPTLQGGTLTPLSKTEPLGLRLLGVGRQLGPQVLASSAPAPHLTCEGKWAQSVIEKSVPTVEPFSE